MKICIELVEEVKEVYEVEYDGNLEDFDPIEHMVESNMVHQKVGNSDYEWYLLSKRKVR